MLPNPLVALAVTLSIAIMIIASYTFYISVAKSLKFWPRFRQMAVISLSVAVISFGVASLLKQLVRIEIQ